MTAALDAIRDEINTAVINDAAAALWNPKATTALATKSLRPVLEGAIVAGPAYTIRLTPARVEDAKARDKFFDAYQEVPAGAVVVVQVCGDVGGAVLGDVISHMWKLNHVAGVVIDGPVRDVPAIRNIGLPVWSRSITMRGMKTAETVTEAGIEVTCDSVTVRPGDMVIADADGVFVVPDDAQEAVLQMASTLLRSEEKTHAALEGGATLLECYGHPAAPSPSGEVS